MPLFIRPEGSGQAQPREKLSSTQIRLLVGLYVGYSSMMFSRATLDVAIPLMLQDPDTGMDPSGMGTLLTLCSFFYLFGKVSMGYGVDRCGARFVFLWLASFASSMLTYFMSASADAAGMTVVMSLLCVAQSSGWAAMTSLVSLWLQPSQFAMAFGFLSTSSRMGDLASKLALGTAVADGWDWRSLFLVAAALQLAVALANAALLPVYPSSSTAPAALQQQVGAGSSGGSGVELTMLQYHKRTLSSAHQGLPPVAPPSAAGGVSSSGSSSISALTDGAGPGAIGGAHEGENGAGAGAPPSWAQIRAVVASPRFAAVAAAVAALHVVMEFDKYVPLYLHKSLGFPPGLAAQGAALYPLSQLLALGAAGLGYDRLTPRGRLVTTGTLCALVVLFYGAQLGLRVYEVPAPAALHLALIFCSGAAMAVPYYLPASIFLAEVGGKGKCGTLSGLLDASGGVAAMAFHSLVGQLASQERWGTLLALLTGAAAVGLVAMVVFHRLNLAVAARQHERAKRDKDILSTESSVGGGGLGKGGGHHHLHGSLGSSVGLGVGGGSGGSGSGIGMGSSDAASARVGLIPRVLGWLLGAGAGEPRKRRMRKDSSAGEDYHPLLDPQRNTFLSSHHLTV